VTILNDKFLRSLVAREPLSQIGLKHRVVWRHAHHCNAETCSYYALSDYPL
jgi:hypothetical protein